MARLWQCGFELNSGVEFSGGLGGGSTIQTSTVRSGTYALEITGLSSGTEMNMRHNFKSANSDGPFYFRFYFRYATAPSAANTIFRLRDSTNTKMLGVKFNSDGTLGLFRASTLATQIGSNSSALSVNTWYRVEVLWDSSGAGSTDSAALLIDGSTAASATNLSFANGVKEFAVGGNLNAEAQTTGDWFFDDIAINDNTGGSQTSYPGAGNIIHLKPNAAGDVNGFAVQVGGTAGSSNNFTRVQEVTPDDATTYNGSAILNSEDLFNCDNSGIGASDTVNVVAVGIRMADLVGADATAALKLEIEKTGSGTKSQSADIVPNSVAWVTNSSADPKNYQLVTYTDPDSAAWTQTTLDSMQIGYIQDVTNLRTIAISTVWASVDYTPAAGGAASGNDWPSFMSRGFMSPRFAG